MTSEKAWKVAEELALQAVRNWHSMAGLGMGYVRSESYRTLESCITTALLQFAQAQESEAVRELVAGLEPFAGENNGREHMGDNIGLRHLRVDLTLGHCRKAAALVAKHSKKGTV